MTQEQAKHFAKVYIDTCKSVDVDIDKDTFIRTYCTDDRSIEEAELIWYYVDLLK